jgi:hypothetical protein
MKLSGMVKGTGDSPVLVDRSRRVSCKSVFGLGVLAFLLAGAGKGCADMGEKGMDTLSATQTSFSIYALSRGKGVPEGARHVLDEARILLKTAQEQGAVIRLTDQRIGLEGETRVCAEFRDRDSASEWFSRIQQIGQGVDLINVKIESCPP